MELFRCRNCGFLLVHDGLLTRHIGHTWVTAGNDGTFAEWLKVKAWRIAAWLRK